MMLSSRALAGTARGEEDLFTTTSDTTFKILDATPPSPDPMAWGLWDELAAMDEPSCAIQRGSEARAKLMPEDPTPVAPVPPALVSGGGVILGAAMLKMIRQIRRG